MGTKHDTYVHGGSYIHVSGIWSVGLDKVKAHHGQRCHITYGTALDLEGISQ
jgi:hypothetical protein